MDITQFVTDNSLSQLSLYATRCQERIKALTDKMPDISILLQNLVDLEDGELHGEQAVHIWQNIFSLYSEGVTCSNADGQLVYIWIRTNPQDPTSHILTIGTDQNDNTKFTGIVHGHYDPEDQTDAFIELGSLKIEDYFPPIGTSLSNLLVYSYSETASELSIWYDTIKTFLGGAWNNCSEFSSYISDKLKGCSNGVSEVVASIKDVLSNTTGGVSGFANALVTKLNLGSKLTAGDHNNIDTSDANLGIWKVSSINMSMIMNGIASIGQFLGNILLFAGGGVLKVVGGVINGVSTVIKNLNTTLTTGENSAINDEGWFPTFPGNTPETNITKSSFLSDFKNKLLDYPAIVDTGWGRILFAQNNEVYDDTDASNKLTFRYYQNALFDLDLLPILMDEFESHYGLQKASQEFIYRTVFPDSTSSITSFQDNIAEIVEQHTIDQETFEAYTEDQRKFCYVTGLFLWAMSLQFCVGTDLPHPNMTADSIAVWSWLAAFNSTQMKQFFSGTYEWYDAAVQQTWTVGGSLFDLLLARLWYLYHINSNQLTPSILHDDTWKKFVDAKNNFLEWLNDSSDWLTSDIFATSFYAFSKGHIVMNNGTRQVINFNYGAVIFTRDWYTNKSLYYNNYYLGSGTVSIIRYLPPQLDMSIRKFIVALGIAIAIATVTIGAVWGYKRLTRNSRQASMYADYSAAVEAYKGNPTKANLKAVKRTTRKLKVDQKLYGTSKYMSALSTAKFGWDSSDSSSSTDTTGLLTQSEEDVNNSDVTQVISLIRT